MGTGEGAPTVSLPQVLHLTVLPASSQAVQNEEQTLTAHV